MKPRKIPSAKVFYITISVYRYIDFFTRREYSEFLLEWLKLYQTEYGLVVYDWVIMTNHVHLIASSENTDILSLLEDFKKSSSLQFLEMIKKGKGDVRRHWLLEMFKTTNKEEIFWRGDFHCQGVYKLSYYQRQQTALYRDPVRQGIVGREQDYVLSSYYYKFHPSLTILPVQEVSLDMFQDEDVEVED